MLLINLAGLKGGDWAMPSWSIPKGSGWCFAEGSGWRPKGL
jgi:hypothetical protein